MQEKEKKTNSMDRLDDFSLDDLPDFEQKEEDQPEAKNGLNLDEYGIWVKGGPEDYMPEDSGKEEAVLEDLAIDEGEEKMGQSLPGEQTAEGEELSNIAFPEEEELQNLEEVEILETKETPTESKAMDTENEMASADSSLGDFEEISLNDLGIEISDELPEEVEKKVAAKQPQTAPPPKQEEEAEVHRADDFQELSLKLDDEEEKPITTEEKSEDLSLGGEETELAGVSESEPDFSAFDTFDKIEEVPEIRAGEEAILTLDGGLQEAVEAPDAKEEIEVSLSEEAPLEPSEPEFTGLAGERPLDTKAPAETSLLAKIEEELRSIKAELNALKSELGQLRSKKDTVLTKKEEAPEETTDFFEESEEDETIALTGDELDNILTTAEIKESEIAEEIKESGAEPQEESLELGEEVISYEEEPALEEAQTEVVLTADEGLAELELEEDITAPGQDTEKGEQAEETIEIEIPEFEAEESVQSSEEVPSIDVEPVAETSTEELDLSVTEEATPLDEISELAGEPEPTAEEPKHEEELVTLEEAEVAELEVEPAASTPTDKAAKTGAEIPSNLREEIKSVLSYMDQLLEALPEEKIEEFAKSEYFVIYKKLFEELGLVS